jgi:flagellar motility protein MotE (MotC chaperone)
MSDYEFARGLADSLQDGERRLLIKEITQSEKELAAIDARIDVLQEYRKHELQTVERWKEALLHMDHHEGHHA